jgi:membrane fusion protein, multidrug efflux system
MAISRSVFSHHRFRREDAVFARCMLFPLGGLLAACLILQGCSGDNARSAVERPTTIPVVVVPAASKAVPVNLRSVGNVDAINTIAVKAQVGGQLTRVYFQEGDYVKKGDLLFLIDPRPYEAAVSQMEANLARDTAQLSQAEANLARDTAQQKYASEQAERFSELFRQGVISKGQADQFSSDAAARQESVRADVAAIESARASINASKASLERSRLDLNYCTIRSPIDGRTGNLMVQAGNLVGAGTVNLVSINQVQPIYVTFTAPENRLSEIKQYMAERNLSVSVNPPDTDSAAETGVLTFVDNAVDQSTGTIKLKGTFTNADRKLWPGQFVNVVLTLTVQPNAVVIPAAAIQSGQFGEFVFVVRPDLTVEARPISRGISLDQETVITKGLQPGEKVVTEGQLRLTIGSKVQIKEASGSKS